MSDNFTSHHTSNVNFSRYIIRETWRNVTFNFFNVNNVTFTSRYISRFHVHVTLNFTNVTRFTFTFTFTFHVSLPDFELSHDPHVRKRGTNLRLVYTGHRSNAHRTIHMVQLPDRWNLPRLPTEPPGQPAYSRCKSYAKALISNFLN